MIKKVFFPVDGPQGCRGESMWVRDCILKDDGTYEGELDNSPVFTELHGYKLGDKVHFSVDSYSPNQQYQIIKNLPNEPTN